MGQKNKKIRTLTEEESKHIKYLAAKKGYVKDIQMSKALNMDPSSFCFKFNYRTRALSEKDIANINILFNVDIRFLNRLYIKGESQ